MHNHHIHCEHKSLKYCGHCQVPYCLNCGKEWRGYNYYQYPFYYSSGYLQTHDSNAGQTTAVTCKHE